MTLTKQDIDALVDGLPPVYADSRWKVWAESVAVVAQDLRRALYLAAGLTAEGERKPERVRCVQVINPEYSTDRHFWAEAYEGQFPPHYQLTPGWFVPDGAE